MKLRHLLQYLPLIVLLQWPAAPVLAFTDPPVARPEPVRPDVARLKEILYYRGDPLAQAQAALFLVQSPKEADAVEAVEAGLRRHDRVDVFQALATAIRLQRDSQHVGLLIKALASDQAAIRLAAVEALARLDPEKTVRPLVAMAENANTPMDARQAAVTALGRSFHKSALVPLVSMLSGDSQPLRQSAAAALEELTGQSFGHDTQKWQAWWQTQKDVSDAEWLAARTMLATDRNRRLRDELQRAESQIVQLQQAIYAKLPPADRPGHFQTLAQNEYPAVRVQTVTWIVENLATMNEPDQKKLINLLLHLSEDGVESVQRQAVLALEKVHDPRAFERLTTLLTSAPASVRAAAARSLGRSRPKGTDSDWNKKALAALEKALGDKSLTVAAEAAESMGSLGIPEAAPILAGLLKNSSDGVRQAAARALEQVAQPSIHNEIFAALEDPVAAVRFSLVGALGKSGATAGLGEKEKAEVLRRLSGVLVRDGDPGVRVRAAAVLGDLGTSAELNLLWQRVTANEDGRVQLKAWAAMLDILTRSANWALVQEWDQKLTTAKETDRRVEMLAEVRSRWMKTGAAIAQHDAITLALVQAQVAQRKWSVAAPLALDVAKRAKTEAELQRALRWLLAAGTQAVEDKKPQDALAMIKDAEELLKRAGNDLATEFENLRARASQVEKP